MAKNGDIKPRKMKYRVSAKSNVIMICVCAVISVAVILGALYLCGIRYVRYSFKDGFSVKFVGVTDFSGYPKKGKISYSGADEVEGLTATINSENGTIEYSNGDVYEGEMSDLV
ncbi:MAG: hypothetical protein PUC29_05195, partial [Clostridia bacterium]|nr:hypothetical protein [Clostridia bacterium]